MKKGFTLAEVLMTLGIIGMIAAMTIPAMIHTTNKKATIEQLKKTSSALNHAVYNGVVANGDMSSWNWIQTDAALAIMQNVISPNLNVSFKCSGDVEGLSKHCRYTVSSIDGKDMDIAKDFNTKTKALLSDGSLVAFTDTFAEDEEDGEDGSGSGSGTGSGSGSGDDDDTAGKIGKCGYGVDPRTLCGVFLVDVNGSQKPNVVGKDVFFFGLYMSGSVLPYGANEGDEFINENCSKGSNGRTCAAKLVSGGWDACYNCTNPYPVWF